MAEKISIHALFAEGDQEVVKTFYDEIISIHALFAEGDRQRAHKALHIKQFLSTPSSQRATLPPRPIRMRAGNFYPRPLRRGRLTAAAQKGDAVIFLSTPSSQRATESSRIVLVQFGISIHALFAEGDELGLNTLMAQTPFLSTPSSQRATWYNNAYNQGSIFLSTPSSQRATTSRHKRCILWEFLSTPSSQRATSYSPVIWLDQCKFLSTPSSQRATESRTRAAPIIQISIHALFAEGDMSRTRPIKEAELFLSTPSSQRATSVSYAPIWCKIQFLSTPSSQRATKALPSSNSIGRFLSTPSSQRATRPCRRLRRAGIQISIHALFAEGDGVHFDLRLGACISIHALFAEGDAAERQVIGSGHQFLSTPSSQRATSDPPGRSGICRYFYPRPLRRGRRRQVDLVGLLQGISIHALFAEGDRRGGWSELYP